MFNTITLRGRAGRLNWGYRTAADLSEWTIQRKPREDGSGVAFTLTARIRTVDRFQARQRPLLFTAPRPWGGGFWTFPIREITVGELHVIANLDAPVM